MLIAVLIPLIGYLYVKYTSDRATVMPAHYLPDSVVVKTRNGKEYSDTIWHQLPEFFLTNQSGNKVSMKDVKSKIIVLDFFFTHCPNICPNMTRSMKLLQDGLKSPEMVGDQDPDFVQFLSVSIDPERDSVPELKKWADRFGVNPQEWWLLTGNHDTIYNFANRELKMMAQPGGPVDSNFLHSDLFVLIDTNRRVRGYYHVLDEDRAIDTAAVVKLARDVSLLHLEKDPSRKFFLAGKLELIAIVFIIAAIGVVLLLTFLKKEKPGAS